MISDNNTIASQKGKQRSHEYNSLCNELDNFYHQIAVKLHLSDSAFDILFTILELGEGCTQTAIYKNIYLSKQTVNSSVSQLISKDILRAEATSRKEVKLYFTHNGKKFIKDKIIPMIKVEDAIFAEMTEVEYAELLSLTQKYLEIVRAKIGAMFEIK